MKLLGSTTSPFVRRLRLYLAHLNITDFEFVNLIQSTIKLIENKPFEVENNDIIVSITAGVALCCDNTYINADTALKIAKNKNKSMFVYDETDNVEKNFQNNIKWTKILKDALKDNRVVVFKQPIINNNNDENNNKYECLLRIKEKDGTFITPYHFLDVAKRIKLYPHLTKIVVAQAFKQAGADIIDVSSGQTSTQAQPVYGRMYQTPFADQIRHEANIPTMTVGNIFEADHANSILMAGRADLVCLARPHLANPYWTHHAAAQLGDEQQQWPLPYGPGKDQLHRLAQIEAQKALQASSEIGKV